MELEIVATAGARVYVCAHVNNICKIEVSL